MKKVAVVGSDFGIRNMFLRRGWELTELVGGPTPDLIQFTGGEDVDPSFYKHSRHPSTYSNPRRDAFEASIFNNYVGKVPMAGICRGGQFLNVMSGGVMYQHVDRHGGSHIATDVASGKELMVTSTHHQMMLPSREAVILLTAKLSTVRWAEETAFEREPDQPDIEAVYYPHTNCLCFQPHPEYVELGHPCQDLYFDYLQQHLGV